MPPDIQVTISPTLHDYEWEPCWDFEADTVRLSHAKDDLAPVAHVASFEELLERANETIEAALAAHLALRFPNARQVEFILTEDEETFRVNGGPGDESARHDLATRVHRKLRNDPDLFTVGADILGARHLPYEKRMRCASDPPNAAVRDDLRGRIRDQFLEHGGTGLMLDALRNRALPAAARALGAMLRDGDLERETWDAEIAPLLHSPDDPLRGYPERPVAEQLWPARVRALAILVREGICRLRKEDLRDWLEHDHPAARRAAIRYLVPVAEGP